MTGPREHRRARAAGRRPAPRNALSGLAAAALLGALLGGCAGAFPEAEAVCTKPVAKGTQRAPMYQCMGGMGGASLVNRNGP